MTMIRMTTNSESNHLDELRKLFQPDVIHIIIASPFLASNIKGLLKEFRFNGVEKVELVTTFKANDPEQLTKPTVLKDFFDYFKSEYPDIKVKIHIDNDLHGKIFTSSNGVNRSLILGSANFTRNGLCRNHEWGLLINDNVVIDEIVDDLFDSIEFPDVTYSQIKRACLFASQYSHEHPEWTKKPDIESNILESVYSVDDENNTDPKYFLKPIGHSESPIQLEDEADFSDLHQSLHFSKKKPKGVRKGDIVITTAVGAGSLLSYFKVTGGLQHVTEEEKSKNEWMERWPWYMEGRNQSQEFGRKWWKHDIRRQDALDEFKNKFPNIPVTYAGGYSLGTLNMGNDKVRITKEFGNFLINKIQSAIK